MAGRFDALIREVAVYDGTGAAPVTADVALEADRIAALKHPDMAFKLAGGVTTCIVGNCGFGAAPHAAAAVMAKTLHPRSGKGSRSRRLRCGWEARRRKPHPRLYGTFARVLGRCAGARAGRVLRRAQLLPEGGH